MIYKIRAILDVEKDVIRDLLISSESNLEQLHIEIAKAFGFNGQEMASFYRTDEEWNEGEEIPLFDMSENGDDNSMRGFTIENTLEDVKDKLIYVYDFLSMWTFFIELTEIKEGNDISELPKVVFGFGDAPEQAPEKEFKAEKDTDAYGFETDLDDEYGSQDQFDNIDDYDF